MRAPNTASLRNPDPASQYRIDSVTLQCLTCEEKIVVKPGNSKVFTRPCPNCEKLFRKGKRMEADLQKKAARIDRAAKKKRAREMRRMGHKIWEIAVTLDVSHAAAARWVVGARPQKCGRCGKAGHNMRTCGNPWKTASIAQVQRCGRCGQPGHNARTCSNIEHQWPARAL